MNSRILISALVVLLTSTVSLAQGLITQTASLSAQAVNQVVSPQTITVQGFDSSLGTLTEVDLSYASNVVQKLRFENRDPVSETYNATATASTSLNGPGSFMLSSSTISFVQTPTLGAFDGHLDFMGTSGLTSINTQTITLTGIDLSVNNYLTSGLVSFSVSPVGNATLSGPGSFFGGNSLTADAQLTVDYVYSPIPEPSASAAWLGLAAFGLMLRRIAPKVIDRFRGRRALG